ncbi:nephrocystin-1-like isoform X3 [Clytia hemisphaerica]|uniref:SH3 domain-containing protein n=1 Tax=Clytia hemisphaerica TaxID=252671 RepID=A0A7M5X3G5_9CNID
MMSRGKNATGLNKLQRQIDQIKFEIDEFCEDDLPNVGHASPGRQSAYSRAQNMKKEVFSLETNLNDLDVREQKLPANKFEEKRRTELKRLTLLKSRLTEVMEQLEPDEVEEDYFRKFESHGTRKSILKSPDNFLNESVPSKSVKIKSVTPSPRRKVTEQNRDGFDEDDDDDDFEEDYLEGESELDVDDEDDDEEEYEETDEDEVSEDQVLHIVRGLTNYNAQQEGDLTFKVGDQIEILEVSDDGWWTGRDCHGNEGLVPSTLVEIVHEEQPIKQKNVKAKPPLEKQRSGKELWENLKDSKTSKTSVTDVLKAMKAIPQGFRSSTLGKWYQKEEYRSSSYVIPKTNSSNLQYNDLYWDPVNKKLRGQQTSTCRTITLVSVKFVPPIGAGVEILSRHVYFALWDGEKILSNIHVVRAVPLERDLSWTFTPKVAKHIPSLYDGELVARINSDDRKISLLMELNYSYVRTSTGERSEISCGWASLSLFDESGAPVGNKNHDLIVNGGTPFEKGVPLDPTIGVNTNVSLMQSILRSNRQPKITVKTTTFNKVTKDIYDMLPERFVTCQRYARFIGYFRQHAATVFCKDDLIERGTVFDTLLAQFPRALDYHDLMDALMMTWEEKAKSSLNRSQRRDNAHVQSVFMQCFNESILGLLQCAHLPPFHWANETAEKARFAFILSFLQKKESLGNLLSAEQKFKPINVGRMAFTNNTTHALYPQPITKELHSPS